MSTFSVLIALWSPWGRGHLTYKMRAEQLLNATFSLLLVTSPYTSTLRRQAGVGVLTSMSNEATAPAQTKPVVCGAVWCCVRRGVACLRDLRRSAVCA